MTEESEKKLVLTDKITDAATKLVITGSGGYAVYSYMADEVGKAIIAGIISGGGILISSFWEGVSERWKPKAKELGGKTAETIEKPFTAFDNTLKGWDFEKQYREALKTTFSVMDVEGFQGFPGLALKDVFVPLKIRDQKMAKPKEIWNFLPKKNEPLRYQRIVIII